VRLERQLLLRRWTLPMLEAIERLGGLQAQKTHTWYHRLWARLDDFQPERLADLLASRQVVRIALMRSTTHVVTALDCLAWRPAVAPVIERSMRATSAGTSLVQVPPRGTWGASGPARHTSAEAWLGRPRTSAGGTATVRTSRSGRCFRPRRS